jgi:hypothetical protein
MHLCGTDVHITRNTQAFLALVDTYDTLVSGIPNFLVCALAMLEIGYKPLGIRLDSGDLAYLSLEARKMFRMVEEQFGIPGQALPLAPRPFVTRVMLAT